MRRRLWLVALLLVMSARAVAAQVRSSPQQRTFHSKALGRDMSYDVVLPPGYEQSSLRYAVLYLLHGYSGDYQDWVTRTDLLRMARRWPLIVVTPDGNNSWYVNSATHPQDRYEDYIVDDVVADVDANFRTMASPHRRAIAGLSMGGYGAMLLALKHPGAFEVAASLSGAFAAPVGIDQVLPFLRPSLEAAYGDASSKTRTDDDVYRLAVSATRAPYLYVACGADDKLISSNRSFVEVLSQHKIPYEYHEYGGAHNWEFWDQRLPQVLEVVARRITQP